MTMFNVSIPNDLIYETTFFELLLVPPSINMLILPGICINSESP